MLSTVLSTLLSIGGPASVTGWTCAKRLRGCFLDGFGFLMILVTACNVLKTRIRRFAKVDVEGSNPFSRSKKS
jgi:hypothetical protein